MEKITANGWKKIVAEMSQLPNPKSLMLFGDPGTGKTVATREAAEELGRKYIPVSLGRVEAPDIKGLPMLCEETKTTSFFPPAMWLEAEKHKGMVLYHFDEFTLASGDVQGAVLDVVQSKSIDEIQLPPNTMIVLSGNKGGDDGTFAQVITSALTGGRAFIYEMVRPSVTEWLQYQKPAQTIETYIKKRGFDALFSHPDKDDPLAPWANARSWSVLDEVVKGLESLGIKPGTDNYKERVVVYARGILNAKIAKDFSKHVNDSIIDPKDLINNVSEAWASYVKIDKLNRLALLKEVVDTLFNSKEWKDKAVRKDAAQKVLDILVKKEKNDEIKAAYLSRVGDNDLLMYEELTYKGKPAGEYWDELMKAGLKGSKKN